MPEPVELEVVVLIFLVVVAAAVLSFGAIAGMVVCVASDVLCHRRSQLLARQPRGDVTPARRPASAGV